MQSSTSIRGWKGISTRTTKSRDRALAIEDLINLVSNPCKCACPIDVSNPEFLVDDQGAKYVIYTPIALDVHRNCNRFVQTFASKGYLALIQGLLPEGYTREMNMNWFYPRKLCWVAFLRSALAGFAMGSERTWKHTKGSPSSSNYSAEFISWSTRSSADLRRNGGNLDDENESAKCVHDRLKINWKEVGFWHENGKEKWRVKPIETERW